MSDRFKGIYFQKIIISQVFNYSLALVIITQRVAGYLITSHPLGKEKWLLKSDSILIQQITDII